MKLDSAQKATLQKPAQRLQSFIAKYDPHIATLARSARSKLRKRMPGAIELVYDNYNALAVGFALTERAFGCDRLIGALSALGEPFLHARSQAAGRAEATAGQGQAGASHRAAQGQRP